MAHLTYKESVSVVWKTTVILSIITIAEVAGVLMAPDSMPLIYIRLFVIVMSLLKAFYIVGTFMHLKYEVNNLILSILIPMTILFWAISAFLWEGDWWLNAKETALIDWITTGM